MKFETKWVDKKMAIEIVDFPINSMVIFHSFLYVYQRVPLIPTSIVPAFQRWISCDDSSPRLSASLAPRDSSEVPPGGTQ